MGLFRNLGVNFLLMSLYDAEGYDVTPMVNTHAIVMDRALSGRFQQELEYNNVYLDFDDCLIVNGQVNIQIVAFIYQCISKKIGVHLLTRHKGEISESLERWRLGGVFDSVSHLRFDEHKSDYIKKEKAIFIDDSFAERLEVKSRLGIAVFAPDSIESLVEWG